MEPRHWHIEIPVKPKAVQSTRGDRGRFHVDPKVRRWKEAILPYIQQAANGEPSQLPIRVCSIAYTYAAPKYVSKPVRAHLEAGGFVPYMAAGDLTDNLNKGVIDVCKGIIFEDDRQIVILDNVTKRYGLSDSIVLDFEEIPGLVRIEQKKI